MHATASINRMIVRLIFVSQVLCMLTACVDNSRVTATAESGIESAGSVAEEYVAEGSAVEEPGAEAQGARDDRPAITLVYGNNIWQPGWAFNDSNGWLALVCSTGTCNLLPATLQVSASSWQGHYDYRATAGQKLSFKTRSSSAAITNVWIKRDLALPWLKPGPVQTYYSSGLNSFTQSDSDTYELTIKNNRGEQEKLVPVLIADGSQNIFLQLRAHGKQQLLDQTLAECYGQLGNNYLLWAGDLDADGESDYIINFLDGVTGAVNLYLSSWANGDNLVNRAGIAITNPLDGECD